jgi:hypothetical protein
VKRTLLLAATMVVLMLTLAFSTPSHSGAVNAANDKCTTCLEKIERDFEKCEAKYGVGQFCYDQFNNDIIHCYATVCEQ